MPSVLDPSLAAPGHQVLHAYTPANEPWQPWGELEPGTEAYRRLREERCRVFEAPLERILPHWRERVRLQLMGTPRTHSQYLRVHQGTYGPRPGGRSGAVPEWPHPPAGAAPLRAGVFPGIGVPPVVVSGAMAAHSFVSPRRHRRLLESLA